MDLSQSWFHYLLWSSYTNSITVGVFTYCFHSIFSSCYYQVRSLTIWITDDGLSFISPSDFLSFSFNLDLDLGFGSDSTGLDLSLCELVSQSVSHSISQYSISLFSFSVGLLQSVLKLSLISLTVSISSRFLST